MSFDQRVSIFSYSDLSARMTAAASRPHAGRRRMLWKALGAGFLFLWLALSASQGWAADVTLAWDPNSESDLEGYAVYFSEEDEGPPYQLYGYLALSELDDSANPAFTVTGLEKGTRYYFTVTAYDTSGSESAFSDSVCADVGDVITPCASASVGGQSGGGSGSGGCFIGASTTDADPPSLQMSILSAFLGGMAALLWFAQRYSRRCRLLFGFRKRP